MTQLPQGFAHALPTRAWVEQQHPATRRNPRNRLLARSTGSLVIGGLALNSHARAVRVVRSSEGAAPIRQRGPRGEASPEHA